MRETKGYALKKRQGLVPTHYDRTSRSFNEGAWKNWRNVPEHLRWKMALAETPSRQRNGWRHGFAPND
jgi:hypothetical protein